MSPRCPRCKIDLVDINAPAMDAAACPECAGIWMPLPTVSRLRALREDIETQELAQYASRIARRVANSEIASGLCAECSGTLTPARIWEKQVLACAQHGAFVDCIALLEMKPRQNAFEIAVDVARGMSEQAAELRRGSERSTPEAIYNLFKGPATAEEEHEQARREQLAQEKRRREWNKSLFDRSIPLASGARLLAIGGLASTTYHFFRVLLLLILGRPSWIALGEELQITLFSLGGAALALGSLSIAKEGKPRRAIEAAVLGAALVALAWFGS